jgi:hypothetical protein
MRPCKYLEEFAVPKIISPRFMIEPSFVYDSKGYLTNDACYIMPSSTPFLAGILNSTVGWWVLRKLTTQVQSDYSQIHISYLTKIPIAKPTAHQRQSIEKCVEKILSAKSKNPAADTTALEREIDGIVYEMYGLTEGEILVVEGVKK